MFLVGFFNAPNTIFNYQWFLYIYDCCLCKIKKLIPMWNKMFLHEQVFESCQILQTLCYIRHTSHIAHLILARATHVVTARMAIPRRFTFGGSVCQCIIGCIKSCKIEWPQFLSLKELSWFLPMTLFCWYEFGSSHQNWGTFLENLLKIKWYLVYRNNIDLNLKIIMLRKVG